jgi:hypothetical protein
LVFGSGCGTDNGAETDTSAQSDSVSGHEAEIRQIQAALDEAIERFKYGDKAALYDMELDYYKDRTTYDEYLQDRFIQIFNADTLDHIAVKDAVIVADTATVEVEVVFLGPSGEYSYDHDTYIMLKRDGRWIMRTLTSTPAAVLLQQEYENAIRSADSAAAAEAEEGL